jgi:hypothetical protein
MAYLDNEGLLYFWNKLKALFASKVDKVDGKGLSTNDYTTDEKDKLAGLSNYIHPTTSGYKHIPSGGATGQILRWSADGTAEWGVDNIYEDATQSVHGLMSTADKKKLDDFRDASSYALKSDITQMYRYKGTVSTVDDLPVTGQTVGDVYDVADGMNYAWNGTKWDALGEVFTITSITNSEIDTVVAS